MLAQLKISVAASHELTDKLTESEKSLKTFNAEVAQLKDEVVGADTVKTDSGKVVSEV